MHYLIFTTKPHFFLQNQMFSINTFRLVLVLTCLSLSLRTIESSETSGVQLFQKEQSEAIFKQRQPTLMLLLGEQSQSSTAFQAVDEVSKKHKGILFTYSKVGELPYSKLIQLIGVHKLTPPVILFFDRQGDKFLFKSDTHGDINARNVDRFLSNSQKGGEEIFMKSDQSYEDIQPEERAENKKYMQYFTGYTLQSTRQHSDKDLIVMVYASWCVYSAELAPTFRQVAKRLKPNRNLIFGKLQGPTNEIRQYEPIGYPSILFWGQGKQGQPLVYFGDRSADDIIEWISSKTDYPWVEPLPAQPKAAEKEDKVQQQL